MHLQEYHSDATLPRRTFEHLGFYATKSPIRYVTYCFTFVIHLILVADGIDETHLRTIQSLAGYFQISRTFGSVLKYDGAA